MTQYFNVLPSGDVENDGWTLVAASATTVWEILAAAADDCYVRCPSYRGGIEVSFPTDVTDLPDGAVIDSVTVFIRMNASAGSGARSVTANVLSSDNRSRYTTRTLHATSSITTYEVGTYSKDPLGRAWDIQRLNKLRLRLFSYNNFSDSIRCYSLYVRVNFHTAPSVTVTSPSGTVNTPSPTVQWSYSQVEGEPQKSAEYKIFTLQQASASTFNPDTAPSVYQATTQGIGNSYLLPTSLNNNDYKVYVRATSQHDAKSPWASKQFTISAPAPGVPGDNNAGVAGVPGVGIPTVVPDNYTSSAAIRMTDTSNLLSVNQADFEIASDPIGYVKGESTTTLSRDVTQAFGNGLASMKILSGASGTASAVSTYLEVYPSQPMTLRAQLKAGSTSRTMTLTARFYDETFTLLGGSITTSGADSSATWTELVATGTSPATAKYAEVVISAASTVSTEAHYADHVGLMYGTSTAWSDGGHASRNMLSAFLATGSDPVSVSDAWVAANTGTTMTRVANSSLSYPTGYHGEMVNQMTAATISPSIAPRAFGASSNSTIFNSTSSGTNFTLYKPTLLNGGAATVSEGDLMIAFVTSTEFGTINPPPGWTAVNTAAVNDGSTDIALWILKRTAGSSEPASWTTGTVSVASTRRSAVVACYSGAAHADSQFVADAVRTETNEPIVHQTATVVNNVANAWRIAAFAASDDHTMTMVANTTPPSTAPTITYVGKGTAWTSSSSTSSFTINKPSGVQSGDLMLASVTLSGIITAPASPPSGWTLVRRITTAGSGNYSNGYVTNLIYRKTATGSEPNSYSATYTGATAYPKMSQSVAYRNVDTTTGGTGGLLTESYSTALNKSSVSSGTVTNTDSNAWRVCFFGAASGTGTTWSGGDVVERGDDKIASGNYDVELSVSDSNGPVSTGSHSRTATLGSGSFVSGTGWIGLLRPLSSPPAAGANETERVEFQTGSSNPWSDIGVYDSNGVVGTGQHSVYGIVTASDGLGTNSMASWIGLIRPASSVQGGMVSAYPNVMIDIGDSDPDALTLSGNKLTMMADFTGSVPGTPTLTAEFYRANQLISSQSATGRAFDPSSYTKSWAVFDVPDGTTRIRPVLSALDRAVADTVQFGRVGVMLGSLPDPSQEPQWRNGTSRSEHPIWAKPVIQYQENDGTGYGDWKLLAGQKALPPAYDLNNGQMFYVDHTIIPLNSRRYRVSTYSYGLRGDFFSSGYGPASQEAIFESRAWWLKDIQNLADNMQITVRWKDQQVDTTNMATSFQPIGSQYPVVITEGFKGDTFSLEIHCEQAEFTALMDLLNSGRTLILQSDIDKMWWVRPVGNISANILATGSRQERPRRYVTVTFAQVAPEE